MEKFSIFIEGQPARVTHQSGTRIGQHGTYKSKGLKDWEAQLTVLLWPHRPKKPIEGPVALTATFGYKAYRKKDIGKWKITKPDTDNAIKTVKDIMTRLGYWRDDAQVVHETCKKMWVEDAPGIMITVEELAGDPEQWRKANDEIE